MEKQRSKGEKQDSLKEAFVANGAFDFWLNEEDDIYDKIYGEDGNSDR